MKIVKLPKFGNELVNLPVKTDQNKKIYVKHFKGGVQAGFPSPAEDFEEVPLSLDEKYLHPAESTYIVEVAGESMYPTLQVGDKLVVRTDLPLTDNKVIIASLNNNEFTVKRFDQKNNKLIADNPKFPNIELKEDDTLLCLGIVKLIIRENI